MTSNKLLAVAALGAGLFFFALPSQAHDGNAIDVHVAIPAPVTVVQHDHHDAGYTDPYGQGYASSTRYHRSARHIAPRADAHHGGHHDVRGFGAYQEHRAPRVLHQGRGNHGNYQGHRADNGHRRHR